MPLVKKAVKKKPAVQKSNHLKPRVILYSLSGLGKSSFAAQWDRPGFICDSQEQGIHFLEQSGMVPSPVWIDSGFDCTNPDHWPKLLSRVYTAARDSSIGTLVLESITGIERMGFKYYCKAKYYDKEEEFYAFWRGPKQFSRFCLPDLLEALSVVAQSGKNVIVTAHATTKQKTDPEGVDYLQWRPYCEDDTWNPLHRWASFVLFIGKHIQEDHSRKGGLKKTAKNEQRRLMYLDWTPYCEAKNWYGLTGIIDMGASAQEGHERFLEKVGHVI